jgi:single-strand DNA-binding protein
MSVNKVILIGNAGRDAELRQLPSGVAVANVTLATSTRRKDKNTGETIEETQWHRLTFYDRLAEIAGDYITKGKTIYVEGRIQYGKFTNKDGLEQNTCDIIVSEMKLLGGGRDDEQPRREQPRSQGQQARQQPAQRTQPQGRAQPQRQTQQRAPAGGGSGFDDMDDDIPFVTASMRYDMEPSKVRRLNRTEF